MAITPADLIGVLTVNVVAIALIPVVQSMLTTANFSGTVKTITDLSPVMMAILLLVGSAAYLYTKK